MICSFRCLIWTYLRSLISNHDKGLRYLINLTSERSHGTFRPSLKKLVQSNSEEFIRETTASAFSSQDTVDARLNTLIKLKGIGPATASLLLSTLDPEGIPFFSDELFLWAFWEDKTGSRWDRKIKYTAKEYRELVAKVGELRNRLDVSALDAEKVAYVLGKREGDLSDSAQDDTEAKNGHAPNQHKRHTPSDDSAGDEKKPAAKKQKFAPRSKAPELDGTLSLRRSRRKKAG